VFTVLDTYSSVVRFVPTAIARSCHLIAVLDVPFAIQQLTHKTYGLPVLVTFMYKYDCMWLTRK